MTNESLARSYLVKAEKRLKALATLRDEDAHSDVVREAQELVELALKGMLRERLPRAAKISRRLRRERELALYGDIDFIPTEQYSAPDAQRAYDEAAWVLALAQEAIRPLSQ